MEQAKELTREIQDAVRNVLHSFVPGMEPMKLEPYLVADQTGYRKFIVGIEGKEGRQVVVKLVHEDEEIEAEREKIECQSVFSEHLRMNGIRTPEKYTANGRYCILIETAGGPLCALAEDYCGKEITEISEPLAYRIGALLAQIHVISLREGFSIGCGTLFGAAVKNDVNAFSRFCSLCEDTRLDTDAVSRIKALYQKKMNYLREVWNKLPRAATQGDISINNLVDLGDSLAVFDYNNAGDEVLVSDMVLEGLLTAYEMDLPVNTREEVPQRLFMAFWEGYRSKRQLTEEEEETAWVIYVLYDSLWFTKIVYNENSLEKMLEAGDADGANRKLSRILADLERENDGRFRE